MNINSISYNLFFLVVILILSTLVAFRDYSIGIDTSNYAYVYVLNNDFQGFEPAFRLLIKFFNLFSSEPTFFFGFICFFISFFHYATYRNIGYIKGEDFVFLFLLFSLFLFSSWYISNITNGLRQGLSLSILYYTLIKHFNSKKYISFIIFYAISIMFHSSSIFILPFLLFYQILSFKKFIYLWVIMGIFYLLGLNETIFHSILSIFGYEYVYFLIKEYGLPEYNYYGFNWSFFVYTFFFPLLSFLIYYFSHNPKKILPIQILKLYMMLCLPYFILGFANYSNRYALLSWAFIPFLQLTIINQLNLPKNILLIFSLILFCFGLMFFYLLRLNFFSLIYK